MDFIDEEDGSPAESSPRLSASVITVRISLMPDITALNEMKCARVTPAMSFASVVLPVPGGPHRMTDCTRSCSIADAAAGPAR